MTKQISETNMEVKCMKTSRHGTLDFSQTLLIDLKTGVLNSKEMEHLESRPVQPNSSSPNPPRPDVQRGVLFFFFFGSKEIIGFYQRLRWAQFLFFPPSWVSVLWRLGTVENHPSRFGGPLGVRANPPKRRKGVKWKIAGHAG